MGRIGKCVTKATSFDWKTPDGRTVEHLSKRGRFEDNNYIRYVENWDQRPALNAVSVLGGSDSTSPTVAAFAAYGKANKNYEVLGTNMTTALCTFAVGDVTTNGLTQGGGGITIQTAGADADQAIVVPILITGQSARSQANFYSHLQPRFNTRIRYGRAGVITNLALTSNVATITTSLVHNLSIGQSVTLTFLTGPTLASDCNGTYTVATIPSTTTFTVAKTHANISTGAATGSVIANNLKLQTIWAGLKKTNTPVIATDDDQFYARYLPTENSGNWQIITSRGGTDKNTVLPKGPLPNTIDRFQFNIDENLKPTLILNDVVYKLDGMAGETGDDGSAALTAGINLIHYTGTSANGTTPGTKAIDVLPGYSIQAVA